MTDRARDEVVGLHQFFEQWFIGKFENPEAAFRRLTDALHPAFSMVAPSGEVLERAAVLAALRAAHATVDRSFAIEIRDVVGRDLGEDAALVTYEEWHFVGDRTDSRRVSTAVFVPTPEGINGVQWLHLHETFQPVGSVDAQPSGG